MWKKKKRKKRKEKKRVRGSRVGRGWKRKKTEGDGTGWRSILIWSQKWVFFRAYNRVRRLNWLQCQTSRQVDVTQIEGWGWRGVLLPRSTFFWNLYRQVWYILDHTHTKKKKTSCKRSGEAAALYDSDRDECVIVVEVTGADSTSVQFEMRRWTDRRRGGKKTHASSLIGVRIWKEAGQ